MNKEKKLIIILAIIFILTIWINMFAWAYVDTNYFTHPPFWNITKIVGGLFNIFFCLSVTIFVTLYIQNEARQKLLLKTAEKV